MAAGAPSTSALLTEHFRYTPLTLLDDIINTVNELVFRVINAIEQGLAETTAEQLGFADAIAHQQQLQACKSDQQREQVLSQLKTDEIDAGIVKLESLLNATVDKDFDKFEIYTLRNILAVGHEEEGLADWVQLDHYKGLDLTISTDGIKPERLQMQRKKLHETQKLNAMLKAEEARNVAVIAQLEALLGAQNGDEKGGEQMGFITQTQPTQPSVQYALSQMPAMRQLLVELRAGLERLPSARRVRDEDSADYERRQYIEGQSRRALENKGIRVDGASSGTGIGRRVTKDEIAALEAVVQTLGGAEKD